MHVGEGPGESNSEGQGCRCDPWGLKGLMWGAKRQGSDARYLGALRVKKPPHTQWEVAGGQKWGSAKRTYHNHCHQMVRCLDCCHQTAIKRRWRGFLVLHGARLSWELRKRRARGGGFWEGGGTGVNSRMGRVLSGRDPTGLRGEQLLWCRAQRAAHAQGGGSGGEGRAPGIRRSTRGKNWGAVCEGRR